MGSSGSKWKEPPASQTEVLGSTQPAMLSAEEYEAKCNLKVQQDEQRDRQQTENGKTASTTEHLGTLAEVQSSVSAAVSKSQPSALCRC